MEKYSLNFWSEYYQFYILDAETKAQTDAADFWCDAAGERRLAIGEGLLGVTIATYGNVKGEVRILDNEPELLPNADHVVEASIRLISGLLEFRDCTGYETQLAINLPKTTYRIRISSHNLNSVKNDEGDDFYTIEIWKSRFAKPKILTAFLNNPFVA
jgi:hypothetical protein